jgi:acetylornithine deacetylase/succinyl-diaminopimelate desuccinylase-like protein
VRAVEAVIQEQREESVHVLEELLRIPSISADSERAGDVKRAAEFVAGRLRRGGVETARVVATKGHPIVCGEWLGAPDQPTVLVYGHYDVQPIVDPGEWTTPPFDPAVRDGKIWARGSTDDKGQMLAHVLAVSAHLEAEGRLPVNVKFLIEGEEEVGSANLGPFLRSERERLACDAVVISDTAMYAPGVPTLCTGLRGIAYTELTVRGAATDLHSGQFGGAIDNPALALARVLAGLKDPDTGRILIDGFYDDVREPSEEERAAWRRLPEAEAGFLRAAGVPRLWGEEGWSVLERVWARPSLDVNGIWGGHTKPGESMTVLPARASAKVSMRLVPDQRPADVAAKLERHLRSHLPPTVTLERFRDLHGGSAWTTSVGNPAVQAAFRAVERGFGKKPVPTREGGSIPIVADFQEVLGAPVVLMGFGLPDERPHGPDEHFDLGNFQRGILSAAHFLREIGEVGPELRGARPRR